MRRGRATAGAEAGGAEGRAGAGRETWRQSVLPTLYEMGERSAFIVIAIDGLRLLRA